MSLSEAMEVLAGTRRYAVIEGDCLEVIPALPVGLVFVTDPPYGIDYNSGHPGSLPRSIAGDKTTELRDAVLEWHGDGPAIMFGSWRAPRPAATRALLVWDTGGALGMGDLSIPWKPAHQEIYVLGRGFIGERTTDVLAFPPVQSMARNGRVHPNEKPVSLMIELINKCPPGTIVDPFCGSGSTGVAAIRLGRNFIGIEKDANYCQIARDRLAAESEGSTLAARRSGQLPLLVSR